MNGQPCKLLLSNVQVSPRLQCRVKLDAKSLEALTDALTRGDEFAPILVYRIEGVLWLVDGHHRLETVRKAGVLEILATVIDGTWPEAIRAALNANRGVRLSTADRTKAVLIACAEFPNLSDRAVAELCDVSYKTVGRVRSRPVGTAGQVAKMRQGRDGKLYPPKKNSAKSKLTAPRKDSLAAQAADSTHAHGGRDCQVASPTPTVLSSPIPLASEQIASFSAPVPTPASAAIIHPKALCVAGYVRTMLRLHPGAAADLERVLEQLLVEIRSICNAAPISGINRTTSTNK